jgi:hypothetical protein
MVRLVYELSGPFDYMVCRRTSLLGPAYLCHGLGLGSLGRALGTEERPVAGAQASASSPISARLVSVMPNTQVWRWWRRTYTRQHASQSQCSRG